MNLKQRIQDDMKSAMRAREAAKLSAIRMLIAAIKQREIDERTEMDDAGVIATVEKLVKQRREAASQYESGGRPELAANERFEAEVLSGYLPAALSDAELDAEITAAIATAGASSAADMGKVMALLKPKLAGRADMSEVSRRVRARIAG